MRSMRYLDQAPRDIAGRPAFILGALAIATGLALRLRGITTDFWLDEIWSLQLAHQADSLLAIFTRLAHDNNHPLNTAYLFLVSPHTGNWALYRAHSLLAGLALLAVLIPLGRTGVERVLIAVFASLSAPLVLYSTEARGYMLAAAFSVGAYAAWRRDRPLWFGISASVALLAHLSAIVIYAGLIAAACVRVARRESSARELAAHALPLATALWLYFTFVRVMEIGGGPPNSKLEVALAAASSAAGWGGNRPVTAVGVLFLVTLAFEIWRRRNEPADAVFFAVALLLAPAVALAFHESGFVATRYVLVCVPFALLLLASLCARLWQWRRVAALALVGLWVAGSAKQIAPFLRDGHGHYLQALTYMTQASGGRAVVASDADFREKMIIGFYRPYLPAGHELRYLTKEDRQTCAPAEWHLIELFGHPSSKPDRLERDGATYERTVTFVAGASGWGYVLYRRPQPERLPLGGSGRGC